MEKQKIFALVGLGIIGVLSVTGCGKNFSSSNSAAPATIPSTTKVLDNVTNQAVSSVSPDYSTITFTATTNLLKTIKTGNVIVSGVSSQFPYGMLRKVVSINQNGNQIALTTTQATLDQAIENGTISVNESLTASQIMTATALIHGTSLQLQGMSPLANVSLGTITIPLINAVLYDDGQGHQMTANGSISLTPGIVFTVSIGFFNIKQVTFAITGNEKVDITVSAPIAWTNLEEKVPVYDFYFQPIIVYVGVVPVVIVPHVTVYVNLNGSVSIGLSTGIIQTADVAGGINYDNGLYNLINNVSNSFQYNPPTVNANANVKVSAGPELEVLIDDVVGPTAEIDGYLELSVDILSTPWWILYGGLEGTAGLKVQILSYSLADYTAQIFNLQSLIAQSNSSGSTQNTPNPPANLAAIPGNNVVYLTWDASIGATSYNAYGATSASGPWVALGSTTSTGAPVTGCLNNGTVYYFTVTAVNSAGESGPSNKVSSVAYISNTYSMLGTGIAIDASGNAWIVNPTGYLYKVTPSGSVSGPLSISSYNQIRSIAIDASGNIWVTEFINSQNSNSYVIELNSSGSIMGTYLVGIYPTASDSEGIAIDSSGNIWIADNIGQNVTKLNSSGSIIGTYQIGMDSFPTYLAIDKSGNVWAAFNTQSTISYTLAELNSSGNLINTYTISCGQSCKPEGIAIDASGNIWIANSNSNNVFKLTIGGSLNAYNVGTNPDGIAIDASGNVWIANSGSNNVTELNSSGTIVGIYSTGTNPNGIAVDASGNVWVTSDSNLTEIVGVTTGPQYFPYTGPQWP